jgi:Skp family chaperone for outer membrane proteins
MATTKSYDVIFDRSAVTMLYYDKKYDKSDEILKAMGYAEIKTQEQK